MFDIPTHSANADLSASFHATMAQIAVVGGGITGAAAACRLARNGCKVTVFDMGRTVGGRAASVIDHRNSLHFDHGLQCISTPQNPQAVEVFHDWQKKGFIKQWEGKIGILDAAGQFIPAAEASTSVKQSSLLRTLAASKGPLHTAVPSNGTLVANVLAACPSISVQSSMKVSRAVLDGDTWRLHGTPGGSKDERLLGTFQALLMATHATGIPVLDASQSPTAQTAIKVITNQLTAIQRVPQFCLMLGFEETEPLLPFDAAAGEADNDLAWVAVDSSKPDRAASSAGMQTLVALTSPGFAAKLLFDGPELHDSQAPLPPQTPEYLASRTQAVWDMIREKLIQARGGRPLPEPKLMRLHRWGCAFTTPALEVPCLHATIGSTSLAVAGDFCLGAGVENALLSGMAAADAILAGL